MTIVAFRHRLMFGRIADGLVEQNGLARSVSDLWQQIPIHFPHSRLDSFVLMPNHLHGIIAIGHSDCHAQTAMFERFGVPVAGSLPTIIRSFKAAASRVAARRYCVPHPLWQRGYYERVVRDDDELGRIRQYIENNPIQWEADCENPAAARADKKEPFES